MALLEAQVSTFKGVGLNYHSADATGDSFVNDGRTKAYIRNGATDVVVTVKTQKDSVTVDGYGVIELFDGKVTVEANSVHSIGYLPTTRFNNSEGRVEIEYDDASNVEIAVISYT